MLLTSLTTTRFEFESGTGWALEPEAACLGDVCVPLSDGIGGGDMIDENGMIVRPAEAAPPTRRAAAAPPASPDQLPPRVIEIFTEATKIQTDPESYHAALRNWVEHGADGRFALSPDDVTARSQPRDAWSLEPGPDGPLARFWLGPSDTDPEAWPYEGDRVTDVCRFGAENYYPTWEA